MIRHLLVRCQRGVSLIELLVAIVVFVILFLMIDGVFIAANRSTRQAETGAEVAQNARVAMERMTREIRESGAAGSPAAILVGTGPVAGTEAVVFKSARPSADARVFCVDVTSNAEDLWNSNCNYYTGGPPAAGVSTYAPVWQRYVGYYLSDAGGGVYDLNRVSVNLTGAADALPSPSSLSGGTVIARFIQSFDLTLPGDGTLTVALAGTSGAGVTASGSPVPTQRIILDDTVLIRN
jgi:prepilin-type N-terminal cleavage/methylation domain-containing protein